jgi:hypothetical protein
VTPADLVPAVRELRRLQRKYSLCCRHPLVLEEMRRAEVRVDHMLAEIDGEEPRPSGGLGGASPPTLPGGGPDPLQEDRP